MSIKSLHYNPLIFPYIQGLVVCCVLYQLVMIRRFGWIPLALTLSLIALWQQEKAAWMTQSTLFLVVISIVYMLDLVSKLPIRKTYQGIFIGGFMALILFATVKRNVYAGANFFEKAALFSARLQQCDGMSFQSSGHGGIFRPERIGSFHPLFIPDFSYFGFYNRAYHNEVTLKQILAHNEGKEIQYIGLLPPCYMDSTSQKFLQENFPEEYMRYKSVPAGQSSTTVR